jgi:hypothetical protein
MSLTRLSVAMLALALPATALADTHCPDPVATWKPREQVRQLFEQNGRTVQRIKVDDGCYEVRGVDRNGNRVKATYFPASLRIRSLEVEFGPSGDASDYLGPVQPPPAPASTIERPPRRHGQ